MENFFLKLTGKVNIGEPLELEHDYHISLQGSITGSSKDTNHNGDFDIAYKFEPLTVELLKRTGETLKADRTKKSQKLRNRIYIAWKESKEEMDFLEYYERQMNYLIVNYDDVCGNQVESN